MNGYLLSVIGAVLISAILTAVLPTGKSSGIIKTVLKLACILIIISPVLEYIKYEKNPQKNAENSVIQTDSEFINYYSELRIRLTEESICEEIEEEFSFNAEVEAKWELKNDEIYINKIILVLTGANIEEQTKIGDFLTKKYGFEVDFG